MSTQHLPYFHILSDQIRNNQHYFDHVNKLMFSNKRINFTDNLFNLVTSVSDLAKIISIYSKQSEAEIVN